MSELSRRACRSPRGPRRPPCSSPPRASSACLSSASSLAMAFCASSACLARSLSLPTRRLNAALLRIAATSARSAARASFPAFVLRAASPSAPVTSARKSSSGVVCVVVPAVALKPGVSGTNSTVPARSFARSACGLNRLSCSSAASAWAPLKRASSRLPLSDLISMSVFTTNVRGMIRPPRFRFTHANSHEPPSLMHAD